MKVKLTIDQVEKIYPECKGFTTDGKGDFNRMADILGSREPDLVWACVNAYNRPTIRKANTDRLARLKGLMSKS